jgi:hypothetical protein
MGYCRYSMSRYCQSSEQAHGVAKEHGDLLVIPGIKIGLLKDAVSESDEAGH